MVSLILALAGAACLAEIAADIGYASPARTARRLGRRQNPQQRDPFQYFNSLLRNDEGDGAAAKMFDARSYVLPLRVLFALEIS